MRDIYDDALDAIEAEETQAPGVPVAAAAPSDPDIYDRAFDQIEADETDALQPMLDLAMQTAPDVFASTQALAKSSGLPAELVERNLEAVKRSEQIKVASRVLQDSPTLRRQMADPDFARLAHEDIEQLGALERITQGLKESGSSMVAGLYSGSAGVVGYAEAAAGLASRITKPLAGTVLPADLGGLVQDSARDYRQSIQAYAKSWRPESSGILGKGWQAGLESFARNLPGIPLMLMPGGANAALLGMTLPVAGEEFGAARDKGLGLLESMIYGASQGVIEYGTEKLPMTKLLGDIAKGTGLTKMLAKQVIYEAPTEQLATVLQDLNQWAALEINEGKTFGDYLAERPEAAAITAIATLVGTTGQTTVVHGMQKTLERVYGEAARAQLDVDIIERLAEAQRIVQSLQLTQINPASLEEYLQSLTEDSDISDLYIDASAIVDAGLVDQLSAVSPSVAEQIEQAVELGQQVRIPVEELLTQVAPSGVADALVDHLRTSPDGKTRAEAEEYLQRVSEEYRQQAAGVIEASAEQLAFDAELTAYGDQLIEQLDAIGAYRHDHNVALASVHKGLIGALAKRAGMSPSDFIARYGVLRVSNEEAARSEDGTRATLEYLEKAYLDAHVDYERALSEGGDVDAAAAVRAAAKERLDAVRSGGIGSWQPPAELRPELAAMDFARSELDAARKAFDDAFKAGGAELPIKAVRESSSKLAQSIDAAFGGELAIVADQLGGGRIELVRASDGSGWVVTLRDEAGEVERDDVFMDRVSAIKAFLGDAELAGMSFTADAAAGSQAAPAVSPIAAARDAAEAAAAEVAAFEAATDQGQEIDADAYWAALDRHTNALRGLQAELEALPDDGFALEAATPMGMVMSLTASAQQPGKWQLTRFDQAGEPWGDTQYETKSEALLEFLSDADVSTVRDFGGQFNQRARPFGGEEVARTPIGDVTEIDVDGEMRPALNSAGRPIHPTIEGVRNFWRWFGYSQAIDEYGRPLVGYHGTGADVTEFAESAMRSSLNEKYQGDGFFFSEDPRVASMYAGSARNGQIKKERIFAEVDRVMPPRAARIFKAVVTDGYEAAWDLPQDEINAILREADEAGIDLNDLLDIAEYVELSNYHKGRDQQFDAGMIFGGSGATEVSDFVRDKASRLGIDAALPQNNVMQVYLRAEKVLYTSDREEARNARANGYDATYYTGEGTVGGVPEWVVFSPDQIKSATGNRGTFDPNEPNILYQREAPQLQAVHNLSAENLLFADELGGLAVPSVGVVRADAGAVDGFGEITLIGTRGLVDPTRERVFSGDAYTARFPRPSWPKVKAKAADKLVESIRDAASEFGERSLVDQTWHSLVNTPDAGEVVELWLRSNSVRAMYLRERGMDAAPVMRDVPMRTPVPAGRLEELRPLFDAVDMDQGGDVLDSQEWAALAEAYGRIVGEAYAEKGRPDSLVAKLAEFNYRRYSELEADLKNAGRSEVDTWKTTEALSAAVDPMALDFKRWIEARVLPAFGDPFLQAGKSKKPYTLENIVAAMTDAKVKGKETSVTYGAGQAKAAVSVEFSDLEQMRAAAAESIVDPAQFEAARAQTDAMLEAYRNAVAPFTQIKNWKGEADIWEAMDASMRALAKFSTGKKRDAAAMRQALKREEFDAAAIPDEAIEQAMAAADALMRTPVPYFEAKPQRAVRLDEFAGAVIPENAPAEVRAILERHGVPVREYSPEGDRTAAVREFAAELSAAGAETLFQGGESRGAYIPSLNLMRLSNADLSTFIHETGHYGLETLIAVASDISAKSADQITESERGMLRDVATLMQWFGVRDITEWSMMSFEEKRGHHERFAESFERYVMEGRAPSVELGGAFATMRRMMISVYQTIKNMIARNPDAGALSDEVRQVFDRMIATDEQIEMQARVRSMLPLFESMEQADAIGATIEDWDQYQRDAEGAVDQAKAELAAAGVRDMKWLDGARSRALKRLQKHVASLREEAEMQARREVMTQPVYRAWQFLTGKVGEESQLPKAPKRKSDPNTVDPSIDSLFVAIAKLGGIDRAELESEWGLDPKERIAQAGFGKHVLRRNGGRSIDEMRSLLVQYGYLDPNESDPNWNPREFEERFFEELGGVPHYSSAADYAYLESLEMLPGQQALSPDQITAGRLDLDGLAAIGIPAEIVAHLKNLRMTARAGWHPDVLVETFDFGFDSGDALVRTIAAAPSLEDAIRARTDEIMLERHSDLATPEGLKSAADEAVLSDLRAKVVASQLKALTRATGSELDLRRAARSVAAEIVARLKVRNVRPSIYSAAEARASKASAAALAKDDIETAAREQRNQLLSLYSAKEAYAALREVDSAVKYLARFEGDAARKSISQDYLDQILEITSRFDLRKGVSLKEIDRVTSLQEWIEAQRDEGIEPDIPEWLKSGAKRTHYKNLTVAELRDVVDTIKHIEHLGRLKNRLLTARDNRTLAQVVSEIAASMEAASGGRVIDNQRRNELSSIVTHGARGFMAMHRQLHSLVREMDGFADFGPFWRALVMPMNAAGDREASMRADAAKRLHELAKPVLAEAGKMGGKGQFVPSLGRSLNRGERLAILLNWGNEGNKQRLLDGYGWKLEQLEPILNSFSRAELDFAQGVWDFFESYRPLIAAKERRVNGKEPEWIEPSSFTVQTKEGDTATLRGGYYPVKYDVNQSGEAARNAEADFADMARRAARVSATTRRGYTKNRAEKVVGRPIVLSFDGIYSGANEVIHDLAWHEWLIDAGRLLRKLDPVIRNRYGAEYVTEITKLLGDIAQGDTPATNAFESTVQHLRNGATIAGLGWNLTTSLLQFTGFSNSVVRLGGAVDGSVWLARGLREFYGSPGHMMRKIEEAQEKSEFMRNRAMTMNRDINDIVNRLDKGKSDIRLKIEASFFVLIQKAQMMVDYPTWYAAYEKAMADPAAVREDGTIDEALVISFADQMVVSAQAGGTTKDLARMQRGGPLLKLFTNFYSYFAATLQIAVERTKATDFRKPSNVAMLAGDYLLLMVIPAMLGMIIRAFMKGEDLDDDEWIDRIAAEQIGFIMGMTPITREMTLAVQALGGVGGRFDYAGPAGLRFFAELQKLGVQVSQGELDMPLFRAANNTAGVLFHYPAGQVGRTVAGAVALIDGETSNPAVLVAGPPKN